MEVGEVGAAVTAVEFYLAENLGVVKLLAETSIAVLNKPGCQNNAVGDFEKFFVVIAFRTGNPLGAGIGYHF